MTHELEIRLLREMLRIRVIEETLADLYGEQEMRTPTHFSIGQEAPAVGVCSALARGDVIYSGHRCHAHYLAKGGGLVGMVGELYGKEIGCAKGLGGSVHLNDATAGIIASSAILGQTMAVAVGSAWAFTMNNSRRIAVSFFGDGAVEEGIFHESLNFAALKKLPVIFVCENNLYSTHTPLEVRQPAGLQISERARSYALPAKQVDGNDVFGVYAAAREAVEWCRTGRGPFFLECITYRWREHVGPLWDYDRGYRSKAEVDEWIGRCPIRRATERLLGRGLCTSEELQKWRNEAKQEIDYAIAVAKTSPFPSVGRMLDEGP
jgi:TPP-dependent pyruvate/acetoin dehydrogenase alpha subunit